MEITIEVNGTEYRFAQTENGIMVTVGFEDNVISAPMNYQELRTIYNAIGYIMTNEPFRGGAEVDCPSEPSQHSPGLALGSTRRF